MSIFSLLRKIISFAFCALLFQAWLCSILLKGRGIFLFLFCGERSLKLHQFIFFLLNFHLDPKNFFILSINFLKKLSFQHYVILQILPQCLVLVLFGHHIFQRLSAHSRSPIDAGIMHTYFEVMNEWKSTWMCERMIKWEKWNRLLPVWYEF